MKCQLSKSSPQIACDSRWGLMHDNDTLRRVARSDCGEPRPEPTTSPPPSLDLHSNPPLGLVPDYRMRSLTYVWGHCFVDRSPPDILLRAWLLDDSLVQRRSPRLSTRICRQSSGRRDGRSSLVHQSIFVEGSHRWIGNLAR